MLALEREWNAKYASFMAARTNLEPAISRPLTFPEACARSLLPRFLHTHPPHVKERVLLYNFSNPLFPRVLSAKLDHIWINNWENPGSKLIASTLSLAYWINFYVTLLYTGIYIKENY